jgi:hypothetical protein
MKGFDVKCAEGNEPRILITGEFIESNNLSLKTQEEIVNRARNSNNPFGFGLEVLCESLSLDNIQEFLNDDGKEKYKSDPSLYEYADTIEETAQDFLDYMVFAWMKAEDERGLSAGRSIEKLGEWLWILGREDLNEKINDGDLYNPYGTPALIAVCKDLGINVPDSLIDFAKRKG